MGRSGWSNQRQQEQTADSPERRAHAVLAQSVERLIRNQQVASPNLANSSNNSHASE